MKGHIVALCMAVILSSGVGIANAVPFQDNVTEARWISTSDGTPASNGWFSLDLPNWYDPANVSLFDITLTGHGDNSSSPIDISLSFDDNLATYSGVAAYNVADNTSFTLSLDILGNDLLYNGTDVGDLSHVSLASFDGLDHFWIGYGCHFWHDSSEVNIDQPTPTPEPATVFLLGSGLIGLAGFRRKFWK
jgi:hypothetical protein